MVFRTHREKFFLFLVCLIIGTMVSTQFRSAEHAKQSVNQQRAEDLAEKLKNAEKRTRSWPNSWKNWRPREPAGTGRCSTT